MMAYHLMIYGHVQGVFYRQSLIQTALQLGLRGWVRNLANGCVEAHCEGEPQALHALVTWAWQGPPAARVRHIEQTACPPQNFSDFCRRPDG